MKCYALCYGAVILTDHNVPFRHYKSINLRNAWPEGRCGTATAFLSGESYLGHLSGRETVLGWGHGHRWELTFGLFTVTGIANTFFFFFFFFPELHLFLPVLGNLVSAKVCCIQHCATPCCRCRPEYHWPSCLQGPTAGSCSASYPVGPLGPFQLLPPSRYWCLGCSSPYAGLGAFFPWTAQGSWWPTLPACRGLSGGQHSPPPSFVGFTSLPTDSLAQAGGHSAIKSIFLHFQQCKELHAHAAWLLQGCELNATTGRPLQSRVCVTASPFTYPGKWKSVSQENMSPGEDW